MGERASIPPSSPQGRRPRGKRETGIDLLRAAARGGEARRADGRRAESGPRRPSAVPVGEVIAKVVRGQTRQQDVLSRIEAAWREAVGAKTALDTRVAHFKAGVVTIDVRTSALSQELGVYLKASLLSRLQERSGVSIKDLRCRVGGWEEGPR